MPSAIRDNSTVLFIGDSITDCRRDRSDPRSLGGGYAAMAAGRYVAEHPRCGVRFVNRGIAGDRVTDLRARWKEDCLAVEADLVSVLVGVNDVSRRYETGEATPAEVYEGHYRTILDQAAAQGAALVLVEPFLLPVRAELLARREDLDPKLTVVRRLAAEFGALLVPADGVMAQAAVAGGPTTWSDDGIHLTAAGHALLADAWLRAVGAA